MNERHLRLIAPGLLGPWQQATPELDFRLPGLERLLGAAQTFHAVGTDYEETLFALFGVRAAPDQDLPVAVVSRLGDGGDADEHWWLRADPVHLHTQLQSTQVIDGRLLQISNEEAIDLVADFCTLLQSDGYRLEALQPSRWYLRSPTDPGIQTTPLPALIGRDITSHLPRGPNKDHWRGLLTELQMLAHKSDVNSEREWDNQLQINSVWLWGAGTMPKTKRPAPTIVADDALARGLALSCGKPAQVIPPKLNQAMIKQGLNNALVSFETIRYYVAADDFFRWKDRMIQLEKNWFARCVRHLNRGDLNCVSIYPCNRQVFTIHRRDLRWWHWRPSKSLQRWMMSYHPK